MRTLRLRPARVQGNVKAPPSKAFTHRAFVVGALSGNGLVRNALRSQDTDATLEGLHRLGFLVTHESAGTRVGGNLRPGRQAIDCGASGATLRFLCALASLSATPVTLGGVPALSKRPIAPLLRSLESLGAACSQGPAGFPISVHGPLRGGTARVESEETSQFLSALLMAAPAAQTETVLETTTRVSRPYVDVTLDVLRHHRIQFAETEGRFVIPAGQVPRQRPFDVPGDYSSAAPFLAAAAVTQGSLEVTQLNNNDPQGDKAIVPALAASGAKIHGADGHVRVEGATLKPFTADVGPTPDLFPVLAAVAAFAPGSTTLHGAPHLRLKESDRVTTTQRMLHSFGIDSDARPDGLVIHGGRPRSGVVETFGDHRIAMAASVIALGATGETLIQDADVVAKSYPGYWDDLRSVAPEAFA